MCPLEAQPLSEQDRIIYVISISYDELRMPTLGYRPCHLRWGIKTPLGYAALNGDINSQVPVEVNECQR